MTDMLLALETNKRDFRYANNGIAKTCLKNLRDSALAFDGKNWDIRLNGSGV